MVTSLDSPRRSFLTDRGDRGRRLDRVLCRRLGDLPELSRSELQRWIAAGRVRVAGAVVDRAAHRVELREPVEVELPSAWAGRPALLPEPIPLEVIWEDEHLLAISKPAGLVVHPTFGHREGTLLNALLWRAYDWPEGQRPHLVHRLDRGTSGLVLVAKTREAAGGCGRLFAQRRVSKEYLAVVRGRPARQSGRIVAEIQRDPARGGRRFADRSGAASDRTDYRVVETAVDGSVTLLLCRLHSGRTHQIRVHLEAEGLPLLGDGLYGVESPGGMAAITRPALHSWRLAFDHPVSGQAVELEAPLAPDLAGLLEVVGIGAGQAGRARTHSA